MINIRDPVVSLFCLHEGSGLSNVTSDEPIVTTTIAGMYHDTEWYPSDPDTDLDTAQENDVRFDSMYHLTIYFFCIFWAIAPHSQISSY